MSQEEIPEPVGVRDLPKDKRGVRIPVHVGRKQAQAINVTAFSLDRLILITAERRCTICGWKILDEERCWFPTTPEAVAVNEGAGWTKWDEATEGVGHKECLAYSAVACPWLAAGPGYKRKTAERHGGEVLADKGFERGRLLLAGTSEALLLFRPHSDITVVAGGGPFEILPFERGEELRPLLDELVSAEERMADADDLEFCSLMASTDDNPTLKTRVGQTMAELTSEAGLSRPPMERNGPCLCGSGSKAKFCCMKRYEEFSQRVSRGQAGRRRVVPVDRLREGPAANLAAKRIDGR